MSVSFNHLEEFCKKCVHSSFGQIVGGILSHFFICTKVKSFHFCIECFPLRCKGKHWRFKQ